MITLMNIINEIKIISKITPEMVLDVWDDLYNNRETIHLRFDALEKYIMSK